MRRNMKKEVLHIRQIVRKTSHDGFYRLLPAKKKTSMIVRNLIRRATIGLKFSLAAAVVAGARSQVGI